MSDRDRKPKFRRGGGKAPGNRESGRQPAWRGSEAKPDGPVILYGWHTVVAALSNPQRQIRKLLLTEMNAQGFMTVGLDSQGSEDLGAVALREPLALVLGAEGKGLRQLTRETCSVVARLDMPGEIKSLNVSNAAVLALYIGAAKLGLMG